MFFYHLQYTIPAAYRGEAFALGTSGVGFFFVLSGYVLGLRHGGADFNLKEYGTRRLARVYPLHLVTFAVWSYFYFAAWGNPLIEKFNSGVANLLLLHSMFAGHLFPLGFNAVSWSISCEAVFYTLFPLIRAPQRAIACVLGVSAALLLISIVDGAGKIYSFYPDFFYFNPFARLSEFALGIYASGKFSGLKLKHPTTLELLSLATAGVLLWGQSTVPLELHQLYLAPAFAFVVVVFGCDSGFISRILRWEVLVLLGDASYGFYLWHHMILRWLGEHIGSLLISQPPGFKVAAIAAMLLGITVFSIISHRYIELPLRRKVTNFLLGPGRIDKRREAGAP